MSLIVFAQTCAVVMLAFVLSAATLTRPLLSFLRRGAPVWAVLLFHAVVALLLSFLWLTLRYPALFSGV